LAHQTEQLRGRIRPLAQTRKPNMLVIFGDDIANIDRLARDGALFTDHYARPSYTAARAACTTGQMPIRIGTTTIGIPGSTAAVEEIFFGTRSLGGGIT
jgi:arylsulfatase